MQAALIPPKGLEATALHSKFHLVLPLSVLLRNTAYMNTYKRAAGAGDFIVLDNGEAEGCPATGEELLHAARTFKANEIVLPDVLRDQAATVSRTQKFLSEYGSRLEGYQLMGVAQGISLNNFKWCINRFSEMSLVTTIGLPRLMLKTLRSASTRVDLANWVANKYPGRFQIHALGADADQRKEISWLAKYSDSVRSVDTSMPYNYAISRADLAASVSHIHRPDLYFTASWAGKVNQKQLNSNIETYMRWVQHGGSEASTGEVRGVSATGNGEVRTLAAPFNA